MTCSINKMEGYSYGSDIDGILRFKDELERKRDEYNPMDRQSMTPTPIQGVRPYKPDNTSLSDKRISALESLTGGISDDSSFDDDFTK